MFHVSRRHVRSVQSIKHTNGNDWRQHLNKITSKQHIAVLATRPILHIILKLFVYAIHSFYRLLFVALKLIESWKYNNFERSVWMRRQRFHSHFGFLSTLSRLIASRSMLWMLSLFQKESDWIRKAIYGTSNGCFMCTISLDFVFLLCNEIQSKCWWKYEYSRDGLDNLKSWSIFNRLFKMYQIYNRSQQTIAMRFNMKANFVWWIFRLEKMNWIIRN